MDDGLVLGTMYVFNLMVCVSDDCFPHCFGELRYVMQFVVEVHLSFHYTFSPPISREEDVKVMATRMRNMRVRFVEALKAAGSTLDWSHVTNQIGMFAFSGLTPEQVDRLEKEFHIYMTRDGRMSISGLNDHNIDYIARSFHEVTKQ